MPLKIKLLALVLMFASAANAQFVQPMGYKDYSFWGQINVGNNGAKVTNPSAYLEIGKRSGSTKGVLFPRGNKDSVQSPYIGLIIDDVPSNKLKRWNGSAWEDLGVDTIPLHNQIIQKLDSVQVTADSIRFFKNGVQVLSYARGFQNSDTTNKWVNDIRRRSGTDTVEQLKNGAWQFVYVDSTGGGSSGGAKPAIKTVAKTGFTDINNPTTEEINNYIRINYVDTTGFFSIDPLVWPATSRRNILSGNQLYQAFPSMNYDPVTKRMWLFYSYGTGHASACVPALVYSDDKGQSWSEPVLLQPYTTKASYLTPASCYRSDSSILYAIYQPGINNSLGLPFTTLYVDTSHSGGATWARLTSIDLSGVWGYSANTNSNPILVTNAGSQLVGVWGRPTTATNFSGGVLRSTNWFSTWTYFHDVQDSTVDKFNESALLQRAGEDTIYHFIRSERTSGPQLFYTLSTDDGVTWTNPDTCFFDVAQQRTKPDIHFLSDGRLIIFQRQTASPNKGGVWISEDRGRHFTFYGDMYPQSNPYLYSGSVVVNNTLYTGVAEEVADAFLLPGTKGGRIDFISYPTDNKTYVYKDTAVTKVLSKPDATNVTQYGFTFKAIKDTIVTADPFKRYIFGMPWSWASQKYDATISVGGKIMTGAGMDIISQITSPGMRQNTFYPTPLQGATSIADTIFDLDSSVVISGHFKVGAADESSIWYAPQVGTRYLLQYKPYTRDTTMIDLGTTLLGFSSIGLWGDYVYLFPDNSTTGKKYNKKTGIVSSFTAPPSCYGANLANGYFYLSRKNSNGVIYKFNPKNDTYTSQSLGSNNQLAPGPFDGKYQWFLPYNQGTFFKLRVLDSVITAVGNLYNFSNVIGARGRGIQVGQEIWMSSETGNVIYIFNPYIGDGNLQGFSSSVTLPTGETCVDLKYDGAKVIAASRSGRVFFIDPKEKTYKQIELPHGSTTHATWGLVLFNNKVYTVSDSADKIVSFATTEFGGDKIDKALQSLKVIGGSYNPITKTISISSTSSLFGKDDVLAVENRYFKALNYDFTIDSAKNISLAHHTESSDGYFKFKRYSASYGGFDLQNKGSFGMFRMYTDLPAADQTTYLTDTSSTGDVASIQIGSGQINIATDKGVSIFKTGKSGISLTDSITVQPNGGIVNIDSLDQTSDKTNFLPVVRNPSTGQTKQLTAWTTPTILAENTETQGAAGSISVTGLGTGGTATVEAGSNANAGTVTLNAGTSALATGTVTLNFASAYTGNTPVIVCQLVNADGTWDATASVIVTTQSLSAPVITWTNSTALTSAKAYKISYIIFGK